MIIPLSLKIAASLWLFHWQAIYLLRDVEEKAHMSARYRRQRDGIRGLLVIVRVVIILIALVGIIEL